MLARWQSWGRTGYAGTPYGEAECETDVEMAERERIEHSSTCKQTDGRFEDGGGHQAPITLQGNRYWGTAQR